MKAEAAAASGKRRVLVVEDYFVVAEVYRSFLEKMGFEVVGPAASVDEALSLISKGELDGALLDLSLRGRLVTPVAEQLQLLNCPFIVVTAMEDLLLLPETMRGAPMVEKPADALSIERALREAGVPEPSGAGARRA